MVGRGWSGRVVGKGGRSGFWEVIKNESLVDGAVAGVLLDAVDEVIEAAVEESLVPLLAF